MTAETWAIARFTVLMALLATTLVLPPAIAIGWLLARRTFRGKTLVETIVSLPLVLPPVASGLMLLWLFGRRVARHDDRKLVGDQRQPCAGHKTPGLVDDVHLEAVGGDEDVGPGAFNDLARERVGAGGVEGNRHARRRTIQASDLGERLVEARGDRDDQTGGLCGDGRAERQNCSAGCQALHHFCGPQDPPCAAMVDHN